MPITTDAVEGVLREHDPEQLIEIGAPPDEYDGEAAELRAILAQRDLTEADLVQVWTEWFSDVAWFLHPSAQSARARLVDALNALRAI